MRLKALSSGREDSLSGAGSDEECFAFHCRRLFAGWQSVPTPGPVGLILFWRSDRLRVRRDAAGTFKKTRKSSPLFLGLKSQENGSRLGCAVKEVAGKKCIQSKNPFHRRAQTEKKRSSGTADLSTKCLPAVLLGTTSASILVASLFQQRRGKAARTHRPREPSTSSVASLSWLHLFALLF